ncbi:hypothetical protein XELAEV_18013973mg [Xenopus laevis]|uniref:Uncharacterized protein n=1 Tax=Xenopus laevis TaxID=8355 RepID=A0A974DSX6_XENLA|nr:hypothetical protein XELAEV_18013973mg [Xenopus laevis]
MKSNLFSELSLMCTGSGANDKCSSSKYTTPSYAQSDPCHMQFPILGGDDKVQTHFGCSLNGEEVSHVGLRGPIGRNSKGLYSLLFPMEMWGP